MQNINPDYYFPQYLGGMLQILNFEADEVLVFMFTLAFLNKVGRFLALDIYALITWTFLIGFPILYSRIKRNNPNGYIKHLFYIWGLKKFPYYPNPFINEFTD